ncbi:putative DNA binding domain-containing protein [bacterium]|nr:putative DNA binding domain-containing protein [bacterium]MBU1959450.1 putative DNA binding domain-containing protein [bacterium]
MESIIKLIKMGESQTVEFKTSFQKEVISSVVAFANAKGGKIFVGVDDSGEVLGVDIKKEMLQSWINQIKLGTQPSILVDIEAFEINHKNIAIIEVKEYPMKPIAYKNRYYKRMKNSNHLMSLDEIANMHLQTINASWDYYIDERHDFSDISQENIDYFIKKVENNLGKTFNDDPFTVLKKYELIKEDKLTFGAYLLFTSNNSALTAFQIGRFKDAITIIDNIDINTNLFTQIDLAIAFIKKHLMTEFIITGEPQRTVKYDYPLEAIREIVINMIVHRDYRDSGNSIIKIFDDRIEFFNPGKLYDDLTIEKLQSGDYSSRTRNRAIARAFKEAGIIERYGSGIGRIKNECKLHGVIEPIFEEFVHGFRVVLFKEKQDGVINGVINGVVNGVVNEGIDSLYDFIKKHPNQKANIISEKLGIPLRTIQRWLKELKVEEKIEFKGAPKIGGYFVK